MLKRTLMTIVLVFTLGTAAPLFGHCDAMEGPVVTEARHALEAGEVTLVLKWVTPEDEAEIKQAFELVLAARKQGPEAKEVADLYFFQTLVRLHRKSEGEPFTGLKPGDGGAGVVIKTVDTSLEELNADEVVGLVTTVVEEGIRHRFHKAAEAKAKADQDVEAGREYVHAYVNYMHYTKHLYETASGEFSAHGDAHGEEMSHESQMERLAEMNPGALLEKEHDVTLLIAGEAEEAAEMLRNSDELEADRIADMLDFFTNFVDRCHHTKEEKFYFPAALNETDLHLESLLTELKREHDEGARLLGEAERNLEQARHGDENARERLAQNLSEYAEMIRAHIEKENAKLTAVVVEALPDSKRQQVTNEFLHYEHDVLGEGFHQKYHDLAMKLTGRSEH